MQVQCRPLGRSLLVGEVLPVVGAEPLWTMAVEVPSSMVLSENTRKVKRSEAGTVKELRLLGRHAARASGVPSLGSARLVVRVGMPDRRRRDLHNLIPTIKALVDGLVDAGLLPDDSWRHLQGPDLRHDPELTSPAAGVVPMFRFEFWVLPVEMEGAR